MSKTVKMTVQVDYRKTGYSERSSETTTFSRTEGFTDSFRQLDTSGSVSGTYGAVSGEMEFAVSSIQQDIRSSLNEQETSKATNIQYQEGRYQIWRTVRNSLVIGGENITTVRDSYIYDTEEDLSLEFLQEKATEYINLNLLPPGIAPINGSILRYSFQVKTPKKMYENVKFVEVRSDQYDSSGKTLHSWNATVLTLIRKLESENVGTKAALGTTNTKMLPHTIVQFYFSGTKYNTIVQ